MSWSRGPSAATTVVGVIGDPVSHSLSPLLHNAAFEALGLDWVSVGFPVPTGGVPAALAGIRALGIRGLSVTMPHKETAAALVDRLTPEAVRLGAVNCVRNDGAMLAGGNTDGEGLVAALRRGAHFEPSGRSCVVIGAGGAARAVVAALADAGASEVVVVARTVSRGQLAAAVAGPIGRLGAADDVRHAALVVNATPVGMAGPDPSPPDPSPLQLSPLDPSLLGPGQVVVDLVYNPPLTPWLVAARQRGATTVNGLGMLVHQAAAQLAWWTGQEAPVDAMWRAAESRQGS